ncbi:AGAP006217-PA, partial [Anopheles gambiae str. PEST]
MLDDDALPCDIVLSLASGVLFVLSSFHWPWGCLSEVIRGSVYGKSDRSRRHHRAVREQRPPWFRPTRSPSRTTRWLRVSRTRSKAAARNDRQQVFDPHEGFAPNLI